MAAIGPLTAKIVANSEGLDPGLKVAEDKVKASADKIAEETGKSGKDAGKRWAESWADGVRGLAKGALGLGKDLASFAERAMTNPGRVFADAVGALGNVAGRMPVLGPLLALPFEGAGAAATMALDAYDKGAERLKLLGQEAMRANMPLGDFQVLAESMGGDLSASAAQIFKFQAALEAAANAGLGAKNVFTELGLDALELQTRGTKAAFGEFADKVRGLGTSFAQAAAAKEIWGRGAADLMPTLLRGSEFMDKRQKLLGGFGAGFSDADFENLKKAQAAKKEWSLLWQGLETQVTIGLAPVFRAFSELMPKLSEMGVTAKGLAPVITEIGFGILTAGAAAVEFVIDALKDPWGTITKGWELAKGMLIGIATEMGVAIGKGIDAGLASGGGVGEAFSEFFTQKRMKESKAFLERSREALEAAEFEKANPGWGKPPSWMEMGPGREDYLANWLAETSAMGPQLESGGTGQRLADRVREIRQQLRPAFEGITTDARQNDPFAVWESSVTSFLGNSESALGKFESQWKSLKGFLDSAPKVFGVDDDAAGFRALQLGQQLAGKGGYQLLQSLRAAGGAPLGSQFVGAAEAGSREAYSAVTQYTSARETLEQEIARLLEESRQIEQQHLEEGRKATELLGDLLANLKVGGDF